MSPVISFNLVWWTFGDDLPYYKIAELVPDGRLEGRGTWGNMSIIHHARWTPLGLISGDLTKKEVIGQSIFGISLAILF